MVSNLSLLLVVFKLHNGSEGVKYALLAHRKHKLNKRTSKLRGVLRPVNQYDKQTSTGNAKTIRLLKCNIQKRTFQ